MTKEEIKEYERLDSIFQNDAMRIKEILLGYDVYREPWYNYIGYANHFEISGEEVLWEGTDNDNDSISGSFPSKYLTMDEDAIRKECQEASEKYHQEQKKKKQERAKRDREYRYKMYLELKKEFK